MATTLEKIKTVPVNTGDTRLNLTVFYGGIKHGRCTQLTIEEGFVSMDLDGIRQLRDQLNAILEGSHQYNRYEEE